MFHQNIPVLMGTSVSGFLQKRDIFDHTNKKVVTEIILNRLGFVFQRVFLVKKSEIDERGSEKL